MMRTWTWRSVTVALGLAVSTEALAVDVCRWAEVESDPFAGTQTIRTASGSTRLTLDKDGPHMTFMVFEPGVGTVELPAGFELQWVLADGTKIVFRSARATPALPRAYASEYSAGVVTGWETDYALTPEVIHAIAQSPLTAMRYTVSKERTIEVGEKHANAIQRDFACIASHLPPSEAGGGSGESVASGPVADAAEPGEVPKLAPPPGGGTQGGGGGGGLGAKTLLWSGAAVSGVAAIAFYGDAMILRSNFLDAPSEKGFQATNRMYWTSVGFAVAGAGFTGLAVSGKF
jgi:hypothetical protein